MSAAFADDLRGSASLRAWPVVVLSVGLGSAFHASAGGIMPGWFAALVMALVLWIPARSLMARRAPLPLVAIAVALGQAFVHLFLTATAGHHHAAGHQDAASSGALAPSSAAAAPGTLADALGAGSLPPEAIGIDPLDLALHRLAEEMSAGHAVMGLAHAVVGLVVGLWLARGEQAARALVSLLGNRWSAPQRLLDAADHPIAIEVPTTTGNQALDEPPVLVQQHKAAARVLRGPPASSTLVPSCLTLAA